MKIILSPSKTMDYSKQFKAEPRNPKNQEMTGNIVNRLKSMTKDELGACLKVKGKLLDKAYEHYKDFGQVDNNKGPAILTYRGEVFKQLDIDNYSTEEYVYLDRKLVILSALYGVVKPLDFVEPYRLDMTMKIFNDQSLYSYWSDTITGELHNDIIVNLASKEYSKLVKKPLIDIDFLEYKDLQYKNIAIYSKQARGAMLNYMTLNGIEDYKDLRAFNLNGYLYNNGLSSDSKLVFTRAELY